MIPTSPSEPSRRTGFLGRWRHQVLVRWLYGQTPDERPLTLGQRRIYILSTGAGLGFAITLTVMLLAAINYDLALGYGVVFFLAGVGTLSMGQTYRNLAGLTLVPGHIDNGMVGGTLRVVVYARQQRAEPRPALCFSLADGESSCPPVEITVPCAGEAAVTLFVPALRRGPYRLPPLRVESRFPLGLFRTWTIWRPPLSALVYPAPIHPAPDLPPLTPHQERYSQPQYARQAGNEDFAGLRPHTPADPLHHVAWKVVARRDDGKSGVPELLLKQFHGGEAGKLWLAWSDTLSIPGQPIDAASDQETRLCILCAWVLAADRLGVSYGLHLPGEALPPDRGTAHREACLSRLARFGLVPNRALPPQWAERNNAMTAES